jgi:hypothetical protein
LSARAVGARGEFSSPKGLELGSQGPDFDGHSGVALQAIPRRTRCAAGIIRADPAAVTRASIDLVGYTINPKSENSTATTPPSRMGRSGHAEKIPE